MTPYDLDDYGYQPGFMFTGFTSKAGITYSAYFQDYSTGHIKIHSFGFEPVGMEMDGKFPHDQRIADTIAKVLKDFIDNEGGVILYWPYNDDERRLKLFGHWFKRYCPKICPNLMAERVTFQYDHSAVTICLIYKPEDGEMAKKISDPEKLGALVESKI